MEQSKPATATNHAKSNNAAGATGFMWTLKKLATHAHFISILTFIFIVVFKRSINLWPHPIMFMVTTLFAATFIPPFGLMDKKHFKESKTSIGDETQNSSKLSSTSGSSENNHKKDSTNNKKKSQ
mmetsp:Transcript_9953/g.18688  ORF Transcript_9953/g.18688 Transcript_9953/m.18688 type:complete len:125 (-) Transcript_9953:88-462(-)